MLSFATAGWFSCLNGWFSIFGFPSLKNLSSHGSGDVKRKIKIIKTKSPNNGIDEKE